MAVFIPSGVPLLDQILYPIWYAQNVVAEMFYNIDAWIKGILGDVAAYLKSITAWVADGLRAMISNISSVVRDVVAVVMSSLAKVFNPLFDTLNSIVRDVKSFITGILATIQRLTADLWSFVVNKIGQAIDYVSNLVQYSVSVVKYAADVAIGAVKVWIENVTSYIVSLVQAALGYLRDVAVSIASPIVNWIRALVDMSVELVRQAIGSIQEGIRTLIGGAQSLVASLSARLGDLQKGMHDIVAAMTKGMTDLTAAQRTAFDGLGSDLVSQLLDLFPAQQVQADIQQIQGVVSAVTPAQLTRSEAMRFWQVLMPHNRVTRALFYALFSVSWVTQAYAGIGAEIAEVLAQEYRAQYLASIPSVADVVAAWRRGSYTEAEAQTILARHGFKPDTAHRLLESSQGAPSPFDLIAMRRRGLISDQQLAEGQRQAGLGSEWRQPLYALTEYIPPVPDLVHMAVREAFSPDIAGRFGQYEDFPEPMVEWCVKQGLSAEWAKRYWAAHWSLPSPQQGFEMLHRGVIAPEELEVLLRALDVMPHWREPLTKIAYRPYTRVDIRRMHKTGVLTDDELDRAYQDIGYDAVRALKLAEFTRRLNTAKPLEGTEDLGKLTKAQILDFYVEGLIDDGKARSLLEAGGATSQAADLFVRTAELERVAKERRAEASLIAEQAIAGVIEAAQAEDHLRRLGLSEVEVDRKMVAVYRAQRAKLKAPTRAEAAEMMLARIITETDYVQHLSTLGYSERWAKAFLELARIKAQKGA